MIEYRSSVGRTCRRYSESGSLCVVPSDGGPTIGIRWRHSRESRAAPVLRRSGVARGWSRGHRLHRDRPRCADRRCRGKPCEYRGKWSNGSDGHPPFSRPIRRKRGVRNSKFVQAAFDGAAMTIEKLSDVGDAAPREFQSLGRRWRSFNVAKVSRMACSTGAGYLAIMVASCQKGYSVRGADYRTYLVPNNPNAPQMRQLINSMSLAG